jgi:hypothetical protein
MGLHIKRIQLEKPMKSTFYCLLLLGVCNLAWADVQIKYIDITGATSTMISNGRKVRINGGQMPGYLLFDGGLGEFLMVDPKRNEAVRMAADEVGAMAEVGTLSVGLMPRGGYEKIAGFSTGRYDLLANGEFCGTIYGSSKLIKNPDLKRMFLAMQGMHKISQSRIVKASSELTECQRARTRLAELADTSGFVLRVIDDKGNQTFEVLSIDTGALIEQSEYDIPPGMPVIELRECLKATPQQIEQMKQNKKMDEMMEQIQQNDGQMTPEMQQQMQQHLDQMEQTQQTQ